MILLKPVFVNHDGSPIFCVDLHPQGMKFVTGGLSSEGGRIIIWNLFPVVEKIAEGKDNVPRKLHEMNSPHCVYCLRWNSAGDLLASGGGGEAVMIWRKNSNPDGQAKLFETETWSCMNTLKTLSEGVLDLAWAPQDAWLATAGVDKTIVIWNVNTSEVISRLVGHDGQVKGVAWDPVGMYLASQSDDKTCRIWRTSDWQQQIVISEPFRESRGNTHFLRLSWSPDGQYLVTANATNSGEPTARIVEINGRPIKDEGESWSCEMDFVGHLKEVTCVRFNNALFKKPGVKTKHCVLATGSRDNTVAVWSTVQRGPIVVVRNLFSKSVEDLAWGPNGLLLVACSADGTVGVMVFKELGQVVSLEDQVTTLESMYGKSYIPQLPNDGKIISFTSDHRELATVGTSPVKDEKPQTTPVKSPASSSSMEPLPKAPIKTEARIVNVETSNVSEKSKSELKITEETRLLAKQIETRLADGKRRITPITVSRSGLGAHSFSSSSGSKTKIIVERRAVEQRRMSSSDEMERSPLKRKEPESSHVPAKIQKRALIPIELPRTKATVPLQSKPRILPPSAPILKPCKISDVAIEQIGPLTNSFIEILNNEPQKRFIVRKIHRREYNVEVIWQVGFGSSIVGARATELWTAIVTSNKLLHLFYTQSGRNFRCPICIPYLPAHFLLTPSQKICIVDVLGHITVWDVSLNHVILEDKELRSYLISSSGEIFNILSCEISPDGTPVIGLSNGMILTFCHASGWVLLCDTTSANWRIAQTHPLMKKAMPELEQSSPLRGAVNESKWSTKYSLARMNTGDDSPAELCATGVLVNLLLSAEKLQSPLEYKMLTMDLARFHAENVNLGELEALLKSLIDPVQSEFTGLKKIDLLTEVLEILTSYPQCEALAGTLLPVKNGSTI